MEYERLICRFKKRLTFCILKAVWEKEEKKKFLKEEIIYRIYVYESVAPKR